MVKTVNKRIGKQFGLILHSANIFKSNPKTITAQASPQVCTLNGPCYI